MQGTELFRHLRGIPGDIVLHGSPYLVPIIEPKQAVHDTGTPELNECAVYGTRYGAIALLYALIHEDRSNWGWRADFSESDEILVVAPDPFKGGPGYLYVLPRRPFTKVIGNGICHIAYEPVTPVEVLEVHPTVLEYLQEHCGVRLELPDAA